MFNLGSDDKKELQENMKEIKNLIDGKEKQQESGEGVDFGNNQGNTDQSAPNLGKQDQGEPNQGLANQQDTQGFSGNNNDTNTGGNNQMTQPSNQSNQQPSQSNQSESGFKRQNKGFQNNTGNSQQDDVNRSQENENVLSEREVQNERENQKSNEKTENKKNDSREVREPLFLREEQFTQIREMVEEMSYLTQEMGQKVDRMKKTVRNERDVSKDSDELVEAFTQRRTKIESTIKSGQK